MKKRTQLATVFFVVLIDLMGFGIVLPLLPFYAKNFEASAVVVGLLYSVYSFAQLIFSPIWGSYSDRIGRRPIMLLSTFGAVIAYIMFGLANSLLVLFASRLVAGIMGGNISTAQAYISDITSADERAKGMGLIGAAFGIGFMVGPALATALIHDSLHGFIAGIGLSELASWMAANKYALPGFFAAFMSFCSFALVLFKLPETVDKKSAQAPSREKRHSVFTASFWKKLQAQTGADVKGMLIPLLVAYFILTFGQSSLYSAFPLLSKEKLGLSAEQVGMQFFYIGLIAVFIQGYLIRKLTKKFKEEHIFTVGNVLMGIGLGLIPMATDKLTLSIYLGIMAIGFSLNTPTIMSLISKEAEEENIGAVMGTSQGISGLGRMLGPTWGGLLFGISIGLPFYTTAIIIFGTVYIGIKLHHAMKQEPASEEQEAIAETS